MAVKLPIVIASWKNFELHNLQQKLDDIASEITVKQDDSEASRKKLVEQLKEFKKIANEETKNQASSLIKSFQNEVDFLIKRSKFSEASFLKVYQKILDIVDPTPSLEYCLGLEKKIGKMEDLEIESKNLRETLKEYNEEFKEVKNQEVAMKTLKEKLKNYEGDFDKSLELKMKELEKKVNNLYYEKEQMLLESNKQTLQKLHESELQCRTLEQSFEQIQSELFDAKAKLEDKNIAKAGEIEIILNDLERANQQTSIAQKEVVRLQKLIDSRENENDGLYNQESKIKEVSSLEGELAAKENEISQLVEDVKHLENTLEKIRESSSTQISELKDTVDQYKKQVTNMEQKLLQQRDYEEVKRELSIIKSVEFSSTDDLQITSKPLELLLLEKNKGLQNENTALKVANDSSLTKLSDLERENTRLQHLTDEQGRLISKLETDVLSVQNLSGSQLGKTTPPTQSEIISHAVKEIKIVPSKYLQNQEKDSMNNSFDSLEGQDYSGSADSLLAIVSAQRERFRHRNGELETELSSKNSLILTLQNDCDSLRADNIKLYEKIRFLQSYERNKSSGESFAETRYSSQYESGLDPFVSFSQHEKLRHYASLSPFEKITLFFGKLILSNKSARTVSFIYFAVVHILVFLVLYKMAYTESYVRDLSSDCAKRFAEHMQEVHGSENFSV